MADMVFQDVRIMDQFTSLELDLPRDTATATAATVADTRRFMLSFETQNVAELWP